MGGKKRLTNDEAINVLKNAAWLGWSEQAEKVSEAVWMAVEALKTQLSKEDATSDCISRQASIALADSLKDNLPDDERKANCVIAHNEGILEYQTALSLLPSVQPVDKDINVSYKDCISRQWVMTFAVIQRGEPMDLIDRQDAIRIVDSIDTWQAGWRGNAIESLKAMPSVHPERLSDDDFETIRIHLSAFKERLCNQHRWKEAEEYQGLIDRFLSFASAQPEECTEERTETHACDCISRRDAIDVCMKYNGQGYVWTCIMGDIRKLPSVQPEPQWIPCSERLPEVGAFVLVSKKAFPPNVCMAHRSRDPRSGKEAWNDMLFGKLDDDRVLAWMPLPEPFREEGENE